MNIQLSVIIWTVICFLLLTVILKKLLFNPVLKLLDSRNEKIEAAKQKSEDIEKMKEENESLIATKKAEAAEEKKQAAKAEIQKIQSDGKKEIEAAQRQCLDNIKKYKQDINSECQQIVSSVAPKMETAAAIFAKNIISHRI